jgi:hypothetical protein
MNKEELAAILTGHEYHQEISKELAAMAKGSGLVVVFGASDDLMEFRGAIYDEVDACGGTIAYLTSAGMLVNDCSNDDCPHFEKSKNCAATIEACWDQDGYSWIFKTDIPHATFEIVEDGEKYCRGIVLELAAV